MLQHINLFSFLKKMLMFSLHFSPTLLIYGHPVQRGTGKEEDLLVNLFLGLARCAI